MKSYNEAELPTSETSGSRGYSETRIWLKLAVTALLILLMLIPMAFIQNLITERKERQASVVQEVKSKWAGSQTVTTPYLAVPYSLRKDSLHTKKYLIFPSQQVEVNGNIIPEEKKRSIFSVLLYNSSVDMKGHFLVRIPDNLQNEIIDYNNASVCLGVTDLAGITNGSTIHLDTSQLPVSSALPTHLINEAGIAGRTVLLPAMLGKPLSFTSHLSLRGSDGLSFAPMSLKSSVEISSLWDSPSFNGSQLPATDKYKDGKGFRAIWQSNELNHPFGQVIDNDSIAAASFTSGVNIIQPLDSYTKTMRSVKYAILVIGLTFILFLVIELLQKNGLHPVQYLLVGFALSLFYTLLLSFAEFTYFIVAYSIAAIATIGLITWYVGTQLRQTRTTILLAVVLAMLYGFIYILVSLEDVALLVGSIGLFIILAAIMYATRNIQWNSRNALK